MAVTQNEADDIEKRFMDAFPDNDNDHSVATARRVIAAWDYLYSVMERENNFSRVLGADTIDWQIGNWANDTTMFAQNAHLYDEVIRINEQILSIDWGNDLFYENAKRDIADAYFDMGDPDKCIELYEGYLNEDPLWGWAWIGYYRTLQRVDEDRFVSVLEELYKKVEDGAEFRDKEDLYRELGDEFNTLGNKDKANCMYRLEDEESKRGRGFYSSRQPIVKTNKVSRNAPCPCGSGKKYKFCCGR